MAYYKNQIVETIIEKALTTSFDNSYYISDMRGMDAATIYVEYTPAENTSTCFIQIEGGPNDADLFAKSALLDEDLTGVSNTKQHIVKIEAVQADTAVKRRYLISTADIKLRISAKETTAGDAGTVKVILIKNEQ